MISLKVRIKVQEFPLKLQAMYVKRNIEALSWNHCCSRKAIRITYSEYVSIALGIERVKRMRHIVIGVL
jgi:hypothetical protein